jgi:hypothetical protein
MFEVFVFFSRRRVVRGCHYSNVWGVTISFKSFVPVPSTRAKEGRSFCPPAKRGQGTAAERKKRVAFVPLRSGGKVPQPSKARLG